MDSGEWNFQPTAPGSKYNADPKDRDVQYLGGGHVRRNFRPHETYTPRDLNDANSEKYLELKKKMKPIDICEVSRINPLKEYKNVKFLTSFLTQMAYIKPASQTGLSRANQRKLAKAVRRAKAIGLMPYTATFS
ncbi:hypothetical protein HDU85_003761 [Gaertneriomyces sp. JEL0708]|nr:hypothetical protein HDU85_003761 [Gaertneriomyces sp. JEL0708]